MARLSLNDSFFMDNRFELLANELGWSIGEVQIVMVHFWHQTQELGIYEIDKKKALDLINLPIKNIIRKRKTNKSALILINSDLFFHKDENLLIIKGNEKHVKNLERYRKNASLGGKAKAANKLANGKKNPAQFTTIQNNSTHNKVESNKLLSSEDPPAGRSPIKELAGDSKVDLFLSLVKPSTQEGWLKIYGDADFIKREILKAMLWLENNPSRKPRSERGVSAFMTKWLDRSWERYRKTLPSNGSQKVGADAISSFIGKG